MIERSLTLPRARAGRSSWRSAVLARLGALRNGSLEVEDDAGRVLLGAPAEDGLAARITVRDPRFWRRAALGGSVGVGESYVDGDWDSNDLVAAIRLFARNLDALEAVEGGVALVARPALRTFQALRRNTRAGARRNIAAHYDLGNEFFSLMLDPTMTYSSAVFDPPSLGLEEAQVLKLDLLCRKLALRPTDHLLEIGSGWGSMAIHAASRHGCRVTTTTISQAQHALATDRVARAGLAGRVTVLLADYRDLAGTFDHVVSVEMIEAVGAAQVPTFFEACAARLAPAGRLAVQAITMPERRYAAHCRDVDFIKRHVFPGSNIPSVASLVAGAGRAGLDLRHLEDHAPHYARTLAAWRANLDARAVEVARLTDERFRRLWRYYLCLCEGSFAERAVGVAQLVLARPGAR